MFTKASQIVEIDQGADAAIVWATSQGLDHFEAISIFGCAISRLICDHIPSKEFVDECIKCLKNATDYSTLGD